MDRWKQKLTDQARSKDREIHASAARGPAQPRTTNWDGAKEREYQEAHKEYRALIKEVEHLERTKGKNPDSKSAQRLGEIDPLLRASEVRRKAAVESEVKHGRFEWLGGVRKAADPGGGEAQNEAAIADAKRRTSEDITKAGAESSKRLADGVRAEQAPKDPPLPKGGEAGYKESAGEAAHRKQMEADGFGAKKSPAAAVAAKATADSAKGGKTLAKFAKAKAAGGKGEVVQKGAAKERGQRAFETGKKGGRYYVNDQGRKIYVK